MSPGRAAWVGQLKVFQDRVEISLSPQTLSRLREAILRASALPPSPARHMLSLIEPVPFQPSLPMEARNDA
jgi:hypothetical protein